MWERERRTNKHSVFTPLPHTNRHNKIMFDFEKLEVYSKAKAFNSSIRAYIRSAQLDTTTKDQLQRASFSIVLNLAEGSGRFSHADRKNFFIISRISVFECMAILDVLKDEGVLDNEMYTNFYNQGETISKMTFAMIKNLTS